MFLHLRHWTKSMHTHISMTIQALFSFRNESLLVDASRVTDMRVPVDHVPGLYILSMHQCNALSQSWMATISTLGWPFLI